MRTVVLLLPLLAGWVALAGAARAADVIVNEYNAVDDDVTLEDDAEDPFWGVRNGNGEDWLEVVVITDHLDMRGWEFVVTNDTGDPLNEESFSLTLTMDPVWEDLRSGTIITLSEEARNNDGDYHPEVGQWWLNVRADPTTSGTFVTVACISPACLPQDANWKVSNKDSQITIKDDLGVVVFGPAGEGVVPAGGVGRREVFKLEEDPTATVTPTSNYQDGASSTFGRENVWSAGTMMQDLSALRSVVPYTPLTSVRISEVFPHSDPGVDWLELHNTTGSPIDVGNWYLSDSFAMLTSYQIPPNTIIPAGGRLVVDQTTLGFGFNSACGDEVILSAADGAGVMTGARDWAEFGPVESNLSFGRSPTEDSPFRRLETFTFGSANSAPKIEEVVINEFMYHPPDAIAEDVGEFVELFNNAGAPVDLFTSFSGHGTEPWSLTGGIQYSFPVPTTIAARGYLVVVPFDPVLEPLKLDQFRTFYGIDATVAVVGPYTGVLSNFNDEVKLAKPDTPEPMDCEGNVGTYVPQVVIDEVAYFDWGPWPVEADGGGASIERVDSREPPDDPAGWQANVAGGATPGSLNSVTPPPVPALSPGGLAVLALVLVGVAVASGRRVRRGGAPRRS